MFWTTVKISQIICIHKAGGKAQKAQIRVHIGLVVRVSSETEGRWAYGNFPKLKRKKWDVVPQAPQGRIREGRNPGKYLVQETQDSN